MAKKADLLVEAKALNLDVTDKNTISQMEIAIANAKSEAIHAAEPVAEF